jgi:hypothetical protein
MATKRYVRESSDGWEVMREGDRRSAILTQTQDQAVRRARDIVRREGGGEVHVMNRAGKVLSTAKVSRAAANRTSRTRFTA